MQLHPPALLPTLPLVCRLLYLCCLRRAKGKKGWEVQPQNAFYAVTFACCSTWSLVLLDIHRDWSQLICDVDKLQ